MNLKAPAFHTCLCSKIGEIFECLDEFRTAIGVPAVVNRVYPEENLSSANHFCPGKRVREKDSVARGHVCDWNDVRDFFLRTLLGHSDTVGERGAAEDAQIDLCDAMFFCA